MKFLLCRKSESLFVWNVSSFKWRNSLRFSASSTALAQRKGKAYHLEKWDWPTYAPLSLSLAFCYQDLRIFANQGGTDLHHNVPVPQFRIHKSMCCPVTACSISLIPAEETTLRILPVSRRMLVCHWYSERNIYLGQSCLFILCVFLPGPVGTNNKFISLFGNDSLTFQ